MSEDEDKSAANGNGEAAATAEAVEEEPCKEVIVKELPNTNAAPERKSAMEETNDRLTSQNAVVQPLLTGLSKVPNN